MKVNDPNSSVSNPATGPATGAARAKQAQETQRVHNAYSNDGSSSTNASGDDVQLSDLVQSLQGLKAAVAVESPQHVARVDQIAKAYAVGTYKVDAEATAAGVIDDGIKTTPRNS
jgi:flagellar biosynthesis anti-sigma factor FlgM